MISTALKKCLNFMYLCVCVLAAMCNLQELGFFFYHVGSEDRTQFIRLVGNTLTPRCIPVARVTSFGILVATS